MKYFDIIPPKRIVEPPHIIRRYESGMFGTLKGWKKYAAKTIVMLLLVGMNWAGFSAVGTVLAYYLDIESSHGSVFAAGGLDFSLADSGWIPSADADDLGAGTSVSRNVKIEDLIASSSIPFQYVARMVETGGDTPYCKKLQINASLEGVSVFNGNLLDFNFATTTFATSTSDEWQLAVSLPSGTQIPAPVYCNFDYIVTGWQLPFASSTLGFHDEERVPMALRSTAQETPICFAGKLADFDTRPNGSATSTIAGGEQVDTQYSDWGLTISAKNSRRGPDVAVAFDSGHPTKDEEEFGTPNKDFGGPGEGDGGKIGNAGENSKGKQNVLIIPERLKEEGHRGDSFKGYKADTGTLYFTFAAPTYLESVIVLNNEKDTNTIRLYDAHGSVLRMIPLSKMGANSIQKVTLATEGVSEMRVIMKDESAVDDLCFGAKTEESPSASPIALNEFLPNPEGREYGHDFGKDSDKMPKGEWVELYNNSDAPVDLAGWYVQNDRDENVVITALNTDLHTTSIEGKSWLVVYLNKALLSNRRGTVKFFNDQRVLIDAYDYENAEFCELEPTPGDPNDEDGVGSCRGVPGNKSFARIPDGVGGWVDPVPTPGGENVAELSSSIEQVSFEEVTVVSETEESSIAEYALPVVPSDTLEMMDMGTSSPEVATSTDVVEVAPEIAEVVVASEEMPMPPEPSDEMIFTSDPVMPDTAVMKKEDEPLPPAILPEETDIQ